MTWGRQDASLGSQIGTEIQISDEMCNTFWASSVVAWTSGVCKYEWETFVHFFNIHFRCYRELKILRSLWKLMRNSHVSFHDDKTVIYLFRHVSLIGYPKIINRSKMEKFRISKFLLLPKFKRSNLDFFGLLKKHTSQYRQL